MKNYYQLLFGVFILGICLFWMPQPVAAEINQNSHGHVVDQNGLGINGVEVQYRLYGPRVAGEKDCTNGNTSNCCYRDPGVLETDYCKNDYPNLNVLTRDDPFDGTGPGWYQAAPPCGDLRYYIFIKAPGSDQYTFAGYPHNQAMVEDSNSKVLGATPPTVVPDGCHVEVGTIPGRVVGNVNETTIDYQLVCKQPTPGACSGTCDISTSNGCQSGGQGCNCVKQSDNSGVCKLCDSGTTYNPTTKLCEAPPPPTEACKAPCTRDDASACAADSTKVPGCSCIVPDGSNNGTCGVCPTGTIYNSATKKCEPPPVACQGKCDISSTTGCQAGGNSCNCVDQGGGAGLCQVCPTGTTYNTETKKCLPPPACNINCSSDTYCQSALDGCTACLPSANGKTCQKPFSANMCQCDGIDIQGKIVPGQKSTFVAYAKVSGTDQNIAQVQSLAFHVAKDNTVIFDSPPVSVTVDKKDATATRYKATFTYTFPANIDPKSVYRVYVDSPKCSQTTAMVIESATQVLGTNTCVDPRNGFQKFIGNLFGSLPGFDGLGLSDPCKNYQSIVADNGQINPAASNQTSGADNLQLKTFGQATVTDKSCRFVFFRFSGT